MNKASEAFDLIDLKSKYFQMYIFLVAYSRMNPSHPKQEKIWKLITRLAVRVRFINILIAAKFGIEPKPWHMD